jgi:hypothetical protein
MKEGDLVIYHSKTPFKPPVDHFGIVLEVRNWGCVRSEEVFLKFPLDGSEGWYLSEKLKKVECENEQQRRPPESLSSVDRV